MKTLTMLLLSVLPCLSQNDMTTHKFVNGPFWATLSTDSKLVLLTGYTLGFVRGSSSVSGHADILKLKVDVPDAANHDVAKGLDRFYQEPENLIFPISDDLEILAMKVNGATQAEVETMAESINKGIN